MSKKVRTKTIVKKRKAKKSTPVCTKKPRLSKSFSGSNKISRSKKVGKSNTISKNVIKDTLAVVQQRYEIVPEALQYIRAEEEKLSYIKNFYETELVRIEEALNGAPKSRHHQTKSSSSDSEEELDSESDSESELESDSYEEEGKGDGDEENSDEESLSTNLISSVEVVEQCEMPNAKLVCS